MKTNKQKEREEITEEINFDTLLEVTKRLRKIPRPKYSAIHIGTGLSDWFEKSFPKSNSLYGITVRIDKTLKPNQYMMIPAKLEEEIKRGFLDYQKLGKWNELKPNEK